MLAIDKRKARQARRRIVRARSSSLRPNGAEGLAVAIITEAAADALAGDELALAWFAGAPAPLTYRQIADALGLPADFLPEGLTWH